MVRCFIAIDIPENIKKESLKIQNQIPEFIGKKTEKENLHLTLKFFGEIDENRIELIKDKLREINLEKFETEIDSIGIFSEKFIRIVWLYLSNCETLQEKIDNSLKNLSEPEKRFMSHLTIARIKSIKDKNEFIKKLEKLKITKIKFIVDNFKLKKSILKPEGPVYEDLEKFSLS